MATHAHTTPTPTPHVTGGTPPASRRRTLFAAAGAVIMGGGMTAGAAASVADLVPQSADLLLIELCTRYVQADLRYQAMCARQDEIATSHDAEWQRLDDLVLDEGVIMLDLEPQITAIAATSPAGIRAKATAAAHLTRFLKDSDGGAMLRSLWADLLPASQPGALGGTA